MSAKLIVHKFDSNINFKSLQITIDDCENVSSEARYGEWTEGKSQQKKRDSQKARLVVKIVSGEEFGIFNLDACAKEIEDTEFFQHNLSYRSMLNYNNKSLSIDKKSNDHYITDTFDNTQHRSRANEEKSRGATNMLLYQTSMMYQQMTNRNSSNVNSGDMLSPLELSLEKVKENNARIMENIHMLNRTLNYTKKKEILDIVCPKTMRYPCNSCGKCFVYKTGLKRHYSTRHSVAEIQPRWQVVWTCIECFQVWPRQDLAMEHSNQCCKTDNIDCVREIKTSSLLQCEFCEKVYTSIPRLLRHSKIHTTTNNYECNACETSFTSYKLAEQHWLVCPWLKMCYNFSLPKLLLCNACDRKFRNYDQLYNHRYKVGHFMTKTHCNMGNVNTLGILVYQCEICALWYNSIPTLQTHRNQQHSSFETFDADLQNKMDTKFDMADSTHYGDEAESIISDQYM